MSEVNMASPREGYGEALVELGKINEKVVVLDADVGTSTKSIYFKGAFPDRFIQCGIAEQNMMCIAAGLATTGFIPYPCTFSVFSSKRAADQVTISIAYPKLNVKISGGYGGLPTGKAGATHQAFEDMAIIRAIPNMTLVVPADAVETKKAVFAVAEWEGPVYLRTIRCPVPVIFDDDHKFEIGKSVLMREGNDVTIISCGIMTAKAMGASDLLAKEGIKARVINMHTVKPLDNKAVKKAAEETGAIVTAEDHNIIGGLGGAVAEFLGENIPTYMLRIGVNDRFGESGDNETIYSNWGMNTENIAERTKQFLLSLK